MPIQVILRDDVPNLGTFPIVVQVGRTARATVQVTVEPA